MDFGWGSYDGVDFNLPEVNQTVLPGKKYASPKMYIGMPQWGRKEWIGKLYPPGTKDKDFLENYVKHFNSVELNATHYKIYKAQEIKRWAIRAKGLDFKFCPKMPNTISHYSGFNNAIVLTDSFLEGIIEFGQNLGPIFLQVSEKFSPKQKDKLFTYLQSLPSDLQFFLEVREPGWFENKQWIDELKKMKIGAVITDTPARRDVLHAKLTVPKTIIRFVCDGNDDKDFLRIQAWKEKLRLWFADGLQECYFFLHVHNEIYAVDFAKYVHQELIL